MARGLGPIKRLEVGQSKHVKLRVVLAVLAAAIAVASFGYGIHSLLNRGGGWQTLESYVDGVDHSDDFVVQYYFDSTSSSATAQYKSLCALYTQVLEQANELFYPEGELSKLNAAPNTAVEVDPILYSALEKLQTAGDRCLYLAPISVEYDRVFLSDSESIAAACDPNRDAEAGEYASQLAAFANDPEMIDVELLDGSRVRLRVAQAYLDFAAENEIESFIDFGWMRSAFVVDLIAQTMQDNGRTAGYVSSYDGFTRNLDEGRGYSFNLFDRRGSEIDLPAVMSYTGPMSIVYLRNYPMGEADRWHYYTYADGIFTTAFVDPASGLSKSAADNLVGYSQSADCVDILLRLAPIYLADELDTAALEALPEQQIDAVWFEGERVMHTQQSLPLALTEDGLALGYTIS